MTTEQITTKEVEERRVTEIVEVSKDDGDAVQFVLIGMVLTLIVVVIVIGVAWFLLRAKRRRASE